VTPGHASAIEFPAIVFVTTITRHVANARLVRIRSREQRCPRGTTPRCVIELREAQSILRKCIEVRRLNLAAKATDVRVPDVVCQNDDDVWARRGGVKRRDDDQ
jgi:hypothetical protein